jgi:predicted flap endonuclease-1-like 5' DNA nuclease
MMTSRRALLLAGVLATQAAFSKVLTAAERPAAAAATIPNAAVIYWQAFAQLPQPLAEPEKAKYEAAVANPAAPVADDLKLIVASFAGSLVAACDWNLDYEAGAECR